MLLRYKKSFEKISMGLLSFMPHEKDVKRLLETIHEYETNPEWHLFLWKKDDDLVGLIGVRMEGTEAIIQHLSVNPSHRGEGLGQEMLEKLPTVLPTTSIKPTKDIESFYMKCQNKKEEE